MRAVSDVSLDRFKDALTGAVLDKDWFGWYETSFSWDKKRFLWETGPSKLSANTMRNHTARFWTATDAWERHQASDKPDAQFVRLATPAKLWSHLHLFDYSFLRL